MKVREILYERAIIVNTDFIEDIMMKNKNILMSSKGTDDLIRILNRIFKPNDITFEVAFTRERNMVVDERWKNSRIKSASIAYDGKIYVTVTPYFYKITENDSIFSDFTKTLKSILEHELIHRVQMGKAGEYFPDLMDVDYKEYFSNPVELEAMAAEVIDQLKYAGYNKKRILEMLRKGWTSRGLNKSSRWIDFKSVFDKSEKSRKVINELIKRIVKRLDYEKD